MFPTMSPEGARGAIAWYIATSIIAKADAGGFPTDNKPKHKPVTTQQAIDAVCARAGRER